ncbi:pacifastin inhibitor (LCMII) domain-containing protein [Phthorimaea operculella]|nr:pacifastin inhibitor (LCMII) domain-containing protein [Phthorimaea operculella]
MEETESVDHVEHHMVCAARGTFYIGCNTCHCNPLGTDYSCSNKPCPLPEDVELFHELKVVKSSSDRSKKQVCVANRMFIKDCNTCWCNEDGTSFYCTRRVCVPDLPEPGVDQPEELRVIKKECRPNEVFELDCNMCRCNPDGKSYSCTRRACVDMDHHDQPAIEPVVQDAKVLTVQDAKVDRVGALDQTVDGGIHDSKVFSAGQDSKELPMVAGQSVAGSVLQDKKELPVKQEDIPVDQSELQAAVKDAENQPLVRKSRATEEMRKCEPGQEFRLDCNICLCDNLGQDFSCTRHDCNAPNGGEPSRTKRDTSESAVESVTMKCVAGSVFDRECNVCRCTNDGESALCTNKSCTPRAQPLSIDTVTNAPDSDPNFRCNPGEQLKRGCNDCQCSADGRSVFCTVRFCDQDITPPPSSV